VNLNTAGWASPLLRLLARLDSDGPNSTTPVTEINGGNISATNADIALVAKGTGATLAQVPDGTTAGGDKRGSRAVDWQKFRISTTEVASGAGATIGGGQSNRANGGTSTVGGGNSNYALGSESVISGGFGNATTATWATIAGGNGNITSGNYSFVGGGQLNSSTSLRSTVSGGVSNTASATSSTVCGGSTNLANSICSFVSGGFGGSTRSIVGYHVFPASNDPLAATTGNGVVQSALLLLCRETTSATATVLVSDANTASATNQVTLPNNSAYSFSGEVIAGVTGAGDSARWTIDGAIKRGANAASTVMIGTPTVVMSHFDAGAAAWVVAVTANTTLGCITVTVTGAAATTIRWVAKINTTEVTY
jgi:hypothetical protein